jgi:hypothetical protein
MKQYKQIHIAFPDIDFQRAIRMTFTALVENDEFLCAAPNNQKEAIVILAAAFAKANYLLRWDKEPRDHSDYIRSKLYVGCTPHPLDWDVQYYYDTASKEVYSGTCN